jgi:hypothetical protein
MNGIHEVSLSFRLEDFFVIVNARAGASNMDFPE